MCLYVHYMYAWLFVRQQTDVQTLRNSFCVLPLWPWFSPSLTSLTFYVSYFRFVDDVMSADNRPRKGDTVNQSINHSITQACTFTVVQVIKSLQDPLEVGNWGSHARTVVRECCKGDDESQWERVKFDPPPPKNPLTDGHQNLRT